jgi:hypothetical protein
MSSGAAAAYESRSYERFGGIPSWSKRWPTVSKYLSVLYGTSKRIPHRAKIKMGGPGPPPFRLIKIPGALLHYIHQHLLPSPTA